MNNGLNEAILHLAGCTILAAAMIALSIFFVGWQIESTVREYLRRIADALEIAPQGGRPMKTLLCVLLLVGLIGCRSVPAPK